VPNTNEETLKANDDGKIIRSFLGLARPGETGAAAQSLLDCVEKTPHHGRFDPTGTATGRFSSKEPNLQNIGRGELRSCFVAPEDTNLVVADYSQIELRAAAAIAGENENGRGIPTWRGLHRLTAATVLGKPVVRSQKKIGNWQGSEFRPALRSIGEGAREICSVQLRRDVERR